MEISDLRILAEPQQGASYDMLLGLARHAEALGFGAFFRSDHYLRIGDSDGLPGPTDAWITLAGLARDTSSIRLGTLVSPVTFRSPGLLAVSVAQVDHMSSGRIELGLGAGWYEEEHRAYSFAFPNGRARMDSLADQLAIIDGMWRTPLGETFTYLGRVHSVIDSPALPKPLQSPLPIIVGGAGLRRTPALAARYASEFNVDFSSLEEFVERRERVCEISNGIGRTIPPTVSVPVVVCAGRREADFRRRASAIGRTADDLRFRGVAGTIEECIEKLGRWRAAGAERIYLQVLDIHDFDHLELIAGEIAPLV